VVKESVDWTGSLGLGWAPWWSVDRKRISM
jgi:hypothetical protein